MESTITGWVINNLGTDLLWNETDSGWFSWGTIFDSYSAAHLKAQQLGTLVSIYPILLPPKKG